MKLLRPLAEVNIIRFLIFVLAVGAVPGALGLLLFLDPFHPQATSRGALEMLLTSFLIGIVNGVLGVAAACLMIRWGRPMRFVEWISERPVE